MKNAACRELTSWTEKEKNFFKRLDSPTKIQDYLNQIPYNPHYGSRSPRCVIREGKAHCFEGAIFAAAALRMIGHKPLLLDLEASANDDDHVLAVFKERGCWGAIGKSNFTVLRFREPVYRTPRELTMSYFDVFFNSICEKTLRRYSHPLNLSQFDHLNWMTTEEDLAYIWDRLNAIKHYVVLTPTMIRRLTLADPDLVKAGLLGANKAGLYKPKR
jgi:hypothetical protein